MINLKKLNNMKRPEKFWLMVFGAYLFGIIGFTLAYQDTI